MQDDGGALGFAGQHRQSVVVGLAGVDDQRHAEFARQPDLGDERTHLGFGPSVLAEVVQAALADRDDLGVMGELTDPLVVAAREAVRVVGVDPDRRVHLLEFLGQLDGPLARRTAAADGDDALDAGLDGLLDQVRGGLVARRQVGV
jgi:hypothetical protein